MASKKSILITGCSDGGMGSALAVSFHKSGWLVFATARNASKMSDCKSHGIKTIEMDVTSEASVAACVAEVSKDTGGTLDGLCNNAGLGLTIPFSDIKVSQAKEVFEVNFWSIYTTTQACLPLLLHSKHGAMIINHTSVTSILYIPFQTVYNASKGAAAQLTQTMRLELAPFNIRVYELKTGRVKTKIFTNMPVNVVRLPENSLYSLAKDEIDAINTGSIQQDNPDDPPMDTDEWATEVVELLDGPNPPLVIYKGKNSENLPSTILPPEVEGLLKYVSGLNVFEEKWVEKKQKEAVKN